MESAQAGSQSCPDGRLGGSHPFFLTMSYALKRAVATGEAVHARLYPPRLPANPSNEGNAVLQRPAVAATRVWH